MKLFVCNNCGKSFCWDSDFNAFQCPYCRCENLITDNCTIASLLNMLSKTLDSFVKDGSVKNILTIMENSKSEIVTKEKFYDYRSYAPNVWIKERE